MEKKKTQSGKGANSTQKSSKSDKSVSDKVRGKVEKEVKKSVKKGVKAVKKDKKLMKKLTVAIVILLIVAIVAVSLACYFNPSFFQTIKEMFGFAPQDNDKPTIGITPIEGEKMVVNIVDVGQGDGIFVQLPDGKNMVIDIGSKLHTPSPWTTFESLLTSAKVTTIDYLMFSHTDYDHIREGKKLLTNYDVKEIYLPVADENSDISNTWRDLAIECKKETYIENSETKKAILRQNVGEFELAGSGWKMTCHSFDKVDYPVLKKGNGEKLNSVSPICNLEYGGRSIIFTGDANFATEKYLLENNRLEGIDADVLKVGHHGSESSTSEKFLEKIDAEYAVISTNGESYGHPRKETLDRLDLYRDVKEDDDLTGFAQVYRTDKDGTVSVEVGANGVLNLISSKQSEKNCTDKGVAVKAVAYRIENFTIFADNRKEVA
ncbi:MAG: hypothetical protein RSB10_03585 [Clostridia bacterium]